MFLLILIFLIFDPISSSNLTPIVNLNDGPIQGVITEYESIKVYEFLGVPFAKPPINELRLQLPVKPDPWIEVKQTTQFSSSCLQPQMGGDLSFGGTSEDCLYLNVYVTESTYNSSILRPVLVWIHGGGFKSGSGYLGTQGIPMVPIHDVILVTINYRLNAFGFIYFGPNEPSIPGNIGLYDQLEALKWVNQNIQKFGGDPNKVTLFGQSAGSISVSAHLLSPLSNGLFTRAILESGSVFTESSADDDIIESSWELYNKTSCSGSANLLSCLQSLDTSELINNLDHEMASLRFYYANEFLPYKPLEALSLGLFDSSVDLLLGSEQNETLFFMQMGNSEISDKMNYQEAVGYLLQLFDEASIDYFRELYYGPDEGQDSAFLLSQYVKANSDTKFVCPTYVFGQQYATQSGTKGGKVYAYYHTQGQNGDLAVTHGAEIPFVFGSTLIQPGSLEKDIQLSREMMKIWTHFAETGSPPKVGETEWKPFQEEFSAMILNADNLGQVEIERIEFCLKEWPYIVQHIHRED